MHYSDVRHSDVRPFSMRKGRQVSVAAAATVLATIGASATASAQNLVQNPAFTSNLNGWTKVGPIDTGQGVWWGITTPAAFPIIANPYGTSTLSQTVPLAASGRYNFSYYYGATGITPTWPGTWTLTTTIQGITVFSGPVAPTGTMQLASNIVVLSAGPAQIVFDTVNPGYSEFGITGVSLTFLGPNALSLQGLNPNQTTIGTFINSVLAGTTPANFDPVITALSNMTSQADLANALDQLSPEIINKLAVEALLASQQFSNDLMSCRTDDGSGASIIREGQCLWARARAKHLALDHTSTNLGASETTGSFSAGAQLAVGQDLRVGFAVGYDKIDLHTSTNAISDGDRVNVGAVLKYNPGPLLLAAGVTAGWGSYDTTRVLSFGGLNAVATSSSDVDYVSGQLHAAYLLPQVNNWYLKPGVDAAVTNVKIGGFTETGGGGAAVQVAGKDDLVFSVSPGLEIGTQFRFDELSLWRIFLRGGVTWQDTSHFVITGSFVEAPGIAPFSINSKFDQVMADVSAGVDVINKAGATLKVQYDGRFGETMQQNAVSLKASATY